MTGQYIYHTYPFPFSIAMIKSGYYAGGVYYEMEADQFVSDGTLEAYSILLFRGYETGSFPLHNCDSCAKDCGNMRCTHTCCSYEPMDGLDCIPKFIHTIPQEEPINLRGTCLPMDYRYDELVRAQQQSYCIGPTTKMYFGKVKSGRFGRFSFLTRLFRGRV